MKDHMKDDEFDERDYFAALVSGGEAGVRAAARGFRILGFRKNSDIIAGIALGSLDYSGEGSCSALRCAHMSRHASPYLEGRNTWLPSLHTVSLFRFYGLRKEGKGAKGGSLTSSQLNFELLEAFGRSEWSRAVGVAMEMAERGDNEELLSALRSEAIRRHSMKSYAYATWNAVRCLASSDTELLAKGAVPAVTAIASEEISQSYVAARRYIASERFRVDALVDNDHIPPEKEQKRFVDSIRGGVPELAMQILGRQLKEGASLQHLFGLLAIETLNQSFNSGRKSQFGAQIESLSAMIEANRAQGWGSGNAVIELFVACMETTSAASEPGYRRRNETEGSIDEALDLMEKGRPNHLLIHINRLKNEQETAKITSRIMLSSLKCDPETVAEHLYTHCASSIYIGNSTDRETDRKTALMECADLISHQRKEQEKCGQSVLEAANKNDSQ